MHQFEMRLRQRLYPVITKSMTISGMRIVTTHGHRVNNNQRQPDFQLDFDLKAEQTPTIASDCNSIMSSSIATHKHLTLLPHIAHSVVESA